MSTSEEDKRKSELKMFLIWLSNKGMDVCKFNTNEYRYHVVQETFTDIIRKYIKDHPEG